MKAQRVIEHRDHSELAVCQKPLNVWPGSTSTIPYMIYCGQPMQLHITVSPMRGYSYLIVLRCPEHIGHAWGVEPTE